MKEITLQIRDLVGGEFCVAQEDGERVRDAIIAVLESGGAAALSFEGISMLTTPFVRAAISDLYEKYAEGKLRQSLSVQNISSDNMAVFKFVVEDIKRRLQNPQAYDEARRHALESV